MISCSTSNSLHARDSLRARQIYRMLDKSVACSLNTLYVRHIRKFSCELSLRMSSIFNRDKLSELAARYASDSRSCSRHKRLVRIQRRFSSCC